MRERGRHTSTLAALRWGEDDIDEESCWRGWGIVGKGLLTMSMFAAAGASDKPVTGDTVIRETQEAVRATKDYTIHQNDAFQ